MVNVAKVIVASTVFVAISAQAQGNNNQCEDASCAKSVALDKSKFKDDKLTKSEKMQALEVIKVKGLRLNPMSRSAQGSYTLDNELIKSYRFGNGNLNDILGILPGVQYGEGALSTELASNIKPSEVSLVGAQGHQSSYNIDGVNNNSRLSTGNGEADRNLLQDVSSHSQSTFVNLDLLDSIEVYDSNIPAKYGQFSGGLVNANTKTASDKPSYGISYRQTSTDWTEFHIIKSPSREGAREVITPTFDKHSVNLYFSTPITSDSGLVAQFQSLKSSETLDQLGTAREQTQTNTNLLLKYHHNIDANNLLSVSGYYAPYEGQYFDVNARNSDYTIEGGGYSVSSTWQHDAIWGDLEVKLAANRSENSKRAPNYWLSWNNINGRTWGNYNNSIVSLEGGYGDIDKIQQTVTLTADANIYIESIFGTQGQLNVGVDLKQQRQEFNRLTDSVIYNSSQNESAINCGSYTFDCIETQLKRPLSELEAEFGRPLDSLGTPQEVAEEIAIIEQNIQQAGQFFTTRQLSSKSDVAVTVNNIALYSELLLEYRNVDITAGLRYDYNDFFKQHNIAPRLRVSWDIWGDGEHQLTSGLNRYYEANLVHYKLNQAMIPMHQEVRHSYLNQPHAWRAALTSNGFLYRFDETKTPYSDEFSLAYRYQLWGGTLETKWLNRFNKQAINRQREYNEDGQAVLFGRNQGSSHYQRFSVAWMAKFDNQHVELNISKTSNTVDSKSFDNTIAYDSSTKRYSNTENYDDSDLVFFQYQERAFDPKTQSWELATRSRLISRHDLSLENQDYNRPYIVNASWGLTLEQWQFSAHARYVSEQEVVYATGVSQQAKFATSICSGCEVSGKKYPIYAKYNRPSYWTVDGSVKYAWQLTGEDRIEVSFEGKNLLNRRNYRIGPLGNGSELGRSFWLGISYQH